MEKTTPPQVRLCFSKIYAAFQAWFPQENLNRIVIWNCLKHSGKILVVFPQVLTVGISLEHTPKGNGREGRSEQAWFVRAVKPGPLGLEAVLAVLAEVGPGWVSQAGQGQPGNSLRVLELSPLPAVLVLQAREDTEVPRVGAG